MYKDEDGIPLPSATVQIKGTDKGTAQILMVIILLKPIVVMYWYLIM